MEIARGDIVVALLPGDYGKGRPAIVVQSNAYNGTHSSIVVCPITSHLVDAPLFRIPLDSSDYTGLETASQVMVDKVTALKRERVDRVIGRVSPPHMLAIDRALRTWLHLD